MTASLLKLLILTPFYILVPACVRAQSALLYEIDGPGLKGISYLFGTVHVICPEDFVLHPKVTDRLKKCPKLVMELDFDDPDLMKEAGQSLEFSEGKHLTQYLKSGERNFLDSLMKSNFGVGILQMGQITPIGLSGIWAMKIMNCTPKSYEEELARRAGENKSEILGLETEEEQMNYLSEIPMEVQVRELLDLVRNPESTRIEFEKMVSIYKNQDSDSLWKFLSQESGSMEGFNEVIVNKRNQDWQKKLIRRMKNGPTFFAVGAGHLAGPNGLVALLSKKGFRLTPIRW